LIWNARAERAPVQRDDAFVKAGEAALMLGNQDRLEAAVAIAGASTRTGPRSVMTVLPLAPLRSLACPGGLD